jgi:hypothetical protein
MRPVSEQADGLLRRYSKHEEMGVRPERAQDVVRAAHQQFAQHPVASLTDAQLRLAVAGILLLGH